MLPEQNAPPAARCHNLADSFKRVNHAANMEDSDLDGDDDAGDDPRTDSGAVPRPAAAGLDALSIVAADSAASGNDPAGMSASMQTSPMAAAGMFGGDFGGGSGSGMSCVSPGSVSARRSGRGKAAPAGTLAGIASADGATAPGSGGKGGRQLGSSRGGETTAEYAHRYFLRGRVDLLWRVIRKTNRSGRKALAVAEKAARRPSARGSGLSLAAGGGSDAIGDAGADAGLGGGGPLTAGLGLGMQLPAATGGPGDAAAGQPVMPLPGDWSRYGAPFAGVGSGRGGWEAMHAAAGRGYSAESVGTTTSYGGSDATGGSSASGLSLYSGASAFGPPQPYGSGAPGQGGGIAPLQHFTGFGVPPGSGVGYNNGNGADGRDMSSAPFYSSAAAALAAQHTARLLQEGAGLGISPSAGGGAGGHLRKRSRRLSEAEAAACAAQDAAEAYGRSVRLHSAQMAPALAVGAAGALGSHPHSQQLRGGQPQGGSPDLQQSALATPGVLELAMLHANSWHVAGKPTGSGIAPTAAGGAEAAEKPAAAAEGGASLDALGAQGSVASVSTRTGSMETQRGSGPYSAGHREGGPSHTDLGRSRRMHGMRSDSVSSHDSSVSLTSPEPGQPGGPRRHTAGAAGGSCGGVDAAPDAFAPGCAATGDPSRGAFPACGSSSGCNSSSDLTVLSSSAAIGLASLCGSRPASACSASSASSPGSDGEGGEGEADIIFTKGSPPPRMLGHERDSGGHSSDSSPACFAGGIPRPASASADGSASVTDGTAAAMAALAAGPEGAVTEEQLRAALQTALHHRSQLIALRRENAQLRARHTQLERQLDRQVGNTFAAASAAASAAAHANAHEGARVRELEQRLLQAEQRALRAERAAEAAAIASHAWQAERQRLQAECWRREEECQRLRLRAASAAAGASAFGAAGVPSASAAAGLPALLMLRAGQHDAAVATIATPAAVAASPRMPAAPALPPHTTESLADAAPPAQQQVLAGAS